MAMVGVVRVGDFALHPIVVFHRRGLFAGDVVHVATGHTLRRRDSLDRFSAGRRTTSGHSLGSCKAIPASADFRSKGEVGRAFGAEYICDFRDDTAGTSVM